jgi:hypothetical protein
MSFTIRARLTVLYFMVLAASFTAFFWICDYGFQKSINTAVNDASKRNLDTVRGVLERHISQGSPDLAQELARLSGLWESGAIFEVAGPDGRWLYRSPRFLSALPALQIPAREETSFQTTNLEALQYRVARRQLSVDGNVFLIDAAVPTEPFDQALDNFRLMEKRFLPPLVLLASLLGYWLSGRALAPESHHRERGTHWRPQSFPAARSSPRERRIAPACRAGERHARSYRGLGEAHHAVHG